MYKNELIILILVTWLMGGIIIGVDAQTSSRISIDEYSQADNFFWSADSTTLYFTDYAQLPTSVTPEYGVAHHPGTIWVAYNVYDQTIRYSDTWFEQPDLSEAAYDRLGAARRFGEQTLFFPNPDGTLYAYAQSPHDISQLPTIGITNGSTYISTNVSFLNDDDLRRNHVLWNETGTSLVVYSFYDISMFVGFVTDFQAGSMLTEPIGFELWRSNLGREVFPESTPLQSPIYDLSNHQPGVLMLVGDSYTQGQYYVTEYFPMIWNPLVPEQSEFFDNLKNRGIEAGIFAPEDESRLLFVDETGLILYDRETKTVTLLDETINLDRIWQLRFSPDGRWLFYFDLDEGMIVVNVVSLLAD